MRLLTYYYHINISSDDGVNMLLQNVGIFVRVHGPSECRISASSAPSEPQISNSISLDGEEGICGNKSEDCMHSLRENMRSASGKTSVIKTDALPPSCNSLDV